MALLGSVAVRAFLQLQRADVTSFHGGGFLSQALVVVAPGLWSTGSVVAAHRLSCCVVCGHLLGSEAEPVSLVSAGKFTTEPPGKLSKDIF